MRKPPGFCAERSIRRAEQGHFFAVRFCGFCLRRFGSGLAGSLPGAYPSGEELLGYMDRASLLHFLVSCSEADVEFSLK